MNVARIGIPRCRNLLGFAIETLTLEKEKHVQVTKRRARFSTAGF